MLEKIFGSGGTWGPFVLRLSLGAFSVIHGVQKLFGIFEGEGIDNFITLISGMGLKPATLWAIVIAIIQFLGGIFLILGIKTRAAALLIGIVTGIMLIGGLLLQLEYSVLIIAVAFSLLLTGGGRVSLKD